jgi:hypothetical protein
MRYGGEKGQARRARSLETRIEDDKARKGRVDEVEGGALVVCGSDFLNGYNQF